MTDHANSGDYGPPRPFSSLHFDEVGEGEVVLCGIVRFSPTGRWLHRGTSEPTVYLLTRYGAVYGTTFIADHDGCSVKIIKSKGGFRVENCPCSELPSIELKRSIFFVPKREQLSPEYFLRKLKAGK